jgi:hypothetical protein
MQVFDRHGKAKEPGKARTRYKILDGIRTTTSCCRNIFHAGMFILEKKFVKPHALNFWAIMDLRGREFCLGCVVSACH